MRAVVALATALVLFVGCATEERLHRNLDQQLSDTRLSLPAPSTVPAAQTVPRVAADIGDSSALEQRGSDFRSDFFNRVTVTATTGRFDPNFGPGSGFADLAYAGYDFDLTGYAGPAEIRCYWVANAAPVPGFVGLANWDEDRWDWYDCGPSGSVITLPDMARYTGPSGEALIAVAVTGSTLANLGLLQIGEGGAGPRWHMTQVAASGSFKSSIALATVEGLPMLFYVRGPESHSDHEFVMQRALDPLGQTWAAPETIYTVPDTAGQGELIETCMVAGRLCVFVEWHDGFDGYRDLYLLQAVDGAASSFAPPVAVMEDSESLYLFGAVDAGGFPAIAFSLTTAGISEYWTYFQRALDPQGSAWAAQQNVTPGAIDEIGCELMIVNGNPAIVSLAKPELGEETFNWINFRRAATPDGATWGGPVEIRETPWATKPYAVQATVVASGIPTMLYDSYAGNMILVPATDVDGSGWSIVGAFLGSPGLTDSLELVQVADEPTMSYTTSAGLIFRKSNNASGTDWAAAELLDDTAINSKRHADVNGMPAVATIRQLLPGSYDPTFFIYY